MIRSWEEFFTMNCTLPASAIKLLILDIPSVVIINEVEDHITDELYLDFTFKDWQFSMHNPYSGAYGYWFFYHKKENNPETTQELKKILLELEIKHCKT